MGRWNLLGAAAVAVVFGYGCGGGPCGRAEDRSVPLSELPCASIEGDGPWESHPFPTIEDPECFWLEFRGCSVYRFENPLDREPKSVVGWISFEPNGSFSTVGSGNAFVIEERTESEVTVRNAQNQLFYLRLVLD